MKLSELFFEDIKPYKRSRKRSGGSQTFQRNYDIFKNPRKDTGDSMLDVMVPARRELDTEWNYNLNQTPIENFTHWFQDKRKEPDWKYSEQESWKIFSKMYANKFESLGESIEFAQDLNALLQGMEEDLSNREKEIEENLRAWFGKGKKGGAGGGGWDRYNTKGERIGKCGDSKKGEGKPKCLSKSRAASLRAKGGKKAIGAAVAKKRRNDPNKNRKGKAKNVSNTVGKKKK